MKVPKNAKSRFHVVTEYTLNASVNKVYVQDMNKNMLSGINYIRIIRYFYHKIINISASEMIAPFKK